MMEFHDRVWIVRFYRVRALRSDPYPIFANGIGGSWLVIYNTELASRDRRTLVGVRRWRHGAAGKFSPGFRRFSVEFRRFSSPNGAQIAENPVWQVKFRGFAIRSVANGVPRAPKSGPEAVKEGPRARQGGPVGCPDGPRGATGGFPRRPGDTLETISASRKPSKSSFESSRWRESLEKRIRCGFLLISKRAHKRGNATNV